MTSRELNSVVSSEGVARYKLRCPDQFIRHPAPPLLRTLILDLTTPIGYYDAIETQKGTEKARMTSGVGGVSRIDKASPPAG